MLRPGNLVATLRGLAERPPPARPAPAGGVRGASRPQLTAEALEAEARDEDARG
jgi:hypothetical protein